jgi:hypothetical protein
MAVPSLLSVSGRGAPLVSNGRLHIADRLAVRVLVSMDDGASSIGDPHSDSTQKINDRHNSKDIF